MDFRERLKEGVKFTLQCLIAIFIALEIAEPPNLYTKQLIILMSIYIAIKHNIPEKIDNILERMLKNIKDNFFNK